METVCRSLTGLDKHINGERIQGEYKENGSYQMSWMEQIYSSPDKDEIFLCAYEKLKRDFVTNIVSITERTIKEYIHTGKLIDLDLLEKPEYYEFPEDVVESLPELSVKSVSALSLAASRVSALSVAPAQRYAFSSSIFLERHKTPGTLPDAFSTPGTLPDSFSTPGTLPDAFSTQEDSPDAFSRPGTLPDSFSTPQEDSSLLPPAKQRPRIGGGKTKKKNIKKRKTRKIRSKKTKK
jgi:hypothetical protein